MDQKLLSQVKDYELRNFIVDFRPYLVAHTVNPHKLATCMGADQYLINLVLEPLDTHSKNDRAYDYISGKNDWARFLMALKESGNSHIEHFVIQEINKRHNIGSSINNGVPFNFCGTVPPTGMNTNTNTMPYQNLHPNTNAHQHPQQHPHQQPPFGNLYPSIGVPSVPPHQTTTTNSAFGWTQNSHGQTPNVPYPVQTPGGGFIAICPPATASMTVPYPVPVNMNTNNIFNPGTGINNNIPPSYPPAPNFSSNVHVPQQTVPLSSYSTSPYQNHNSVHNNNFPTQPSAPSMNNINGAPQTNLWGQGPFQPRH